MNSVSHVAIVSFVPMVLASNQVQVENKFSTHVVFECVKTKKEEEEEGQGQEERRRRRRRRRSRTTTTTTTTTATTTTRETRTRTKTNSEKRILNSYKDDNPEKVLLV